MTFSTSSLARSAVGLLPVLLLLGVAPAVARAEPCGFRNEGERDVCREREIYLMPGLVGSMYVTGTGEVFLGAGAQVAPLLWTHNNPRFGPGQGAIFLQASVLRSAGNNGSMGLFELGTTLTIENNASRRWAIPFFGASIGRLVHGELPDSTFVQGLFGLHVFWHQNLIVDLQGGYQFPFAAPDELAGPRLQLTVRGSAW